MIAQDTPGQKEPEKKLPKADSLENAVQQSLAFNYPNASEGPTVIHIGAFNVPRGSVRVTAGEQLLQEDIDYRVNYQVGTVQVLDPSWEVSKMPKNVSVEK